MHGGVDKIVSEVGSQELHARASTKDKTFKVFPDGWHDLLHEPEYEAVFDEFLRWTNERV
jgi:acylglycerol lipase